MIPLAALVAQQSTRQQSVGQAVIYVAILVGVVLAGALVLMRYRKKLIGDDELEGTGDTVSLHTLRTMRDNGQLTEEEYQKASAVVLNAMSPGSNPLRDEIERRARERDASESEPSGREP